MTILGVNHLSLVSKDLTKTANFLKSVLHCEAHPHEGWFRLPGCATLIHIIEIDDAVTPPADDMFHYYTHNALEVDDLVAITRSCLERGYSPFQMDLQGEEQAIGEDLDLSFGLGTTFVRDTDGNLWEFAQRGVSWDALWS